MTEPRILLGEIISVHGIKGEVVIRYYTADPESIGDYGLLHDETGARQFTVTPVRANAKGLVARIAGVSDRTAAEALRGVRLYVERNALPPPEDGTYYVHDLVGLRAIDQQGAGIGSIAAVHNFGAGDILEIKLDGARTTELVPFTGAFVPTVDLAAGTVTVQLPENAASDDDGPTDADASNDNG
jgi:16S rRNA processing protein RimM